MAKFDARDEFYVTFASHLAYCANQTCLKTWHLISRMDKLNCKESLQINFRMSDICIQLWYTLMRQI